MAKKRDPIPPNMTIAEASEFWDKHSVADYPTRVVQMKYAPEGQTTFVAVASDFTKSAGETREAARRVR